jgi:16S rRNA (uracil1498-N3)-methyltransferase
MSEFASPPSARLYHEGPLAPSATIRLDDAAGHHARVLRLRPGDAVDLFNGDGRRYRSRLLAPVGRQALAAVESVTDGRTESPLELGLAQAIPASDKMDWLIEKAVELGVNRIQPLLSQRCVLRLDAERTARRIAHWRRIIIASCMQCGRDRLPTIAAPLHFDAWLRDGATASWPDAASPDDEAGTQTLLLLTPRAGTALSALQAPAGTVWLLAGPEGGFTDAEESSAIGRGWRPVRLGPRVLRTETAGPAALAALQARFGDF